MKEANRGFTLIEVAVAVAILGVALTTLVALQTRLMDNYVHERNLFRATLAAQYLITFLEIETDPPEVGSNDSDLADALRQRGYFDENPLARQIEDDIKGWKITQTVTSIDYDQFQDILRRIEFRISWGDGPGESMSLVLFLNTNKTQQLTQGGQRQ